MSPADATLPDSPAGRLREEVRVVANADAPVRALAAVVCFEPDRQHLTELAERLRDCPLESLLLVDNSETEAGRASVRAVAQAYELRLVASPRNVGVAEAQNIALRVAREAGCTHALLLDQDSLLDRAAIARLIDAYQVLLAGGERVAAVGPALFDPRCETTLPFVRLGRLRMRKLASSPGQLIDCDLLISSGCLLSMDAVDEVGEMDRTFFIDYVDFEWCTRAKSLGYKVFGVGDALMTHTIGDKTIKVMGRVIALHNPIRNYYAIRNAILFARKPYLSWRWRAHLAYRAAGQFVLFTFLCPQPWRRMGWMLRGAWHGLTGRGGRLGGDAGLGEAGRSRPALASALPRTLTADLSDPSQAGVRGPMRASEPVASSMRARLR